MGTQKTSKQASLDNHLLYYGVATAEYDIFADVVDTTVYDYFSKNYGSRNEAQRNTSTHVSLPSKIESAIRKKMSPIYLWGRHINIVSQLFVFFAKIPFVVLWGLLLSFIALYVGIGFINTYHGGFGHISKEHVYNGITTVMINPLSLEGSTHQETFDTSVLQELRMDTYILEPGDTLLALAIEFGLNVDTLVSVNGIQDATSIQIGQKIKVPIKDGIIHTIKRNEMLSSIAKKYNVNKTAIIDVNNLQSEALVSGKQIFIPDAKMNWFDLGLILGTVFQLPAKGRLTSVYGYRISPITGRRHFHGAIDIANRVGTPITAAATGVVSIAGTNLVYGKHIEITHPNGYKTLYTHMHTIYVNKGKRITRGATIGSMGNTGYSTGHHLHFAVYKNGKHKNPLRYVRFR